MRRSLGALLLAGATLMTQSVPAFADEEYMIVPESGAQTERFTLVGRGLEPGLALDINFMSPEGNVFTLGDSVLVVSPDGTFRYEFVPAERFTGSSTGTWTVQGCTSGTDDCAQGTFEIK